MDNLKKLRTDAQKSQQEIADFLGVSNQAYSNYENDKREPDLITLQKLADYFHVSVDYLLGHSSSKPVNEKPAELEDVYFNLAKEAQEKGIHPDDVKKIIAMYEMFKQNDK